MTQKIQGESPMTVAAAIGRRARNVGLSKAELARESGVRYHRILLGYDLTKEEAENIELVLAARERRQGTHRSAAYVA